MIINFRWPFKRVAVQYQALCYWVVDGKLECCQVCPLEKDAFTAWNNAQSGAYDLRAANPGVEIIGPVINVMVGF